MSIDGTVKEKRISLGVYPDVGLKKARDRRDEMRRLVADGINPSAARKQEKLMALDAALNTFEAVAREWFEKHSPNWEASYSKKLLARLEANIFLGWGTARSATSRRQSFCPNCAGSNRAASSRPRIG